MVARIDKYLGARGEEYAGIGRSSYLKVGKYSFLPKISLISVDGLETEHTEVTTSSFKDRVRLSVPLQPFLQKFPVCSLLRQLWAEIEKHFSCRRNYFCIVLKLLGLSHSFHVNCNK